MSRKQLFFGFGALWLMLPVLAQEGVRQPLQVTTAERVDFAAGGTVRLNGSYGDVYVEGWDRSEVEIKTTKSTQNFYEPKQQQRVAPGLERVRIVTERRSATELAISTILPTRGGVFVPPLLRKSKGGVTVAYEIRLPRDSHLVVRHGGGFVLVTNMTKDVTVISRSGDIMLMVPDDVRYSIDAKARFGLVSSDFAGGYTRRYVVGGRFAGSDSSSRRVVLRMGLGGITIKKVPPEASFRAGEL